MNNYTRLEIQVKAWSSEEDVLTTSLTGSDYAEVKDVWIEGGITE